jgi:transcriptional regulator with XRE-family HTH domain
MKNTINARIKLLRSHLNLTGEEFSNLIGITSAQLSRIENGKSEPQNGTINKILDKTNVTNEWLLHGKGELKAHVASSTTQESNPWKDVAFLEVTNERDHLKSEVDNWKKKYDQVWNRLEFFMDRLPLGKFKALNGTILSEISGGTLRVVGK